MVFTWEITLSTLLVFIITAITLALQERRFRLQNRKKLEVRLFSFFKNYIEESDSTIFHFKYQVTNTGRRKIIIKEYGVIIKPYSNEILKVNPDSYSGPQAEPKEFDEGVQGTFKCRLSLKGNIDATKAKMILLETTGKKSSSKFTKMKIESNNQIKRP